MKLRSIPRFQCPKCNGTGQVEISQELLDTLNAVLRSKGTDSVTLSPKFGKHHTITAINNRLERLRELGLLKRERRFRRWFYTAV
jgi:hypothetical protein